MAERKKASKPAPRVAKRKASPAPSVSSEQRQQMSARATCITDEQRQQMIARAAYLRAEKRGFAPGAEMQDWLEAEAEVDQQLGAR